MVEVVSKIINANKEFPNNPLLPLLHYRGVLKKTDPNTITNLFESHGWINCWINGIFPYHHFHSNTHEALGVAGGSCGVQVGGDNGSIIEIKAGDVLIIPAGVAHKNASFSKDFICIGSYPITIPYDMHEGDAVEIDQVQENISKVPLPKEDPVFGSEGPIFEYWQKNPK